MDISGKVYYEQLTVQELIGLQEEIAGLLTIPDMNERMKENYKYLSDFIDFKIDLYTKGGILNPT